MSWTGGSLVLNTGSATTASLSNAAGATLTIAPTGQSLTAPTGTGTATVANAGTILTTGASGVANIDAALANTGTIIVTQGTLSLNAGGSSNGADLASGTGGTLQFGAPASGPGGDFIITGGQYAVDNTTISGGTLDVSAASSVFFVTSLQLAGAGTLLLGAQDATAQNGFVQGPSTWAGATGTPFLSGSGTLTVYGGGTLLDGVQSGTGLTRLIGTSLLGGTFALDGGRTVENDGWLDWSSGSITLGAGDASAATQSGTLSNVAGATFYITADGRIGDGAAVSGVLANAGVMAVFAGAGETGIDASVANTGDIQVQSGTLSLNGGGSTDGSHLYRGSRRGGAVRHRLGRRGRRVPDRERAIHGGADGDQRRHAGRLGGERRGVREPTVDRGGCAGAGRAGRGGGAGRAGADRRHAVGQRHAAGVWRRVADGRGAERAGPDAAVWHQRAGRDASRWMAGGRWRTTAG